LNVRNYYLCQSFYLWWFSFTLPPLPLRVRSGGDERGRAERITTGTDGTGMVGLILPNMRPEGRRYDGYYHSRSFLVPRPIISPLIPYGHSICVLCLASVLTPLPSPSHSCFTSNISLSIPVLVIHRRPVPSFLHPISSRLVSSTVSYEPRVAR